MKQIEVNGYGYKVYDDNGNLIGFEGGNTSEGVAFKDYDAYENSDNEICYISEHGFDDCEGWFIPLATAREEGATKASIKAEVRDAFEGYLLTDEQVEVIADDVFELAEWAYISTYISKNEDIENIILEDCEGFFTERQKKAVEQGLYPCELEVW